MIVNIIILIIILIIIYSTFYYTFYKKYNTKEYREVNNPYTDNKTTLKWPLSTDTYLINNWPNTFDFDLDIKKHIVDISVNLPKEYCIIDCGAHIGDGSIPIADALRYNNRMDIKVYALDPSLEKCEFIKKIAKLNNLYNIIVLQTGLSDNVTTYNHKKNGTWGKNTGGTNWTETCNEEADDYSEKVRFITLDLLVKDGYISEKIGYIHLDVEGMESKAITGALETIKKSKPVLSLEEHNVNDNTLKNILYPLGYKFNRRLGSNNIYI